MNNDQMDDLKQFIAASASQTEERLLQKLSELEQKVDDGFTGIREAIEQIHQQIDENKKETDTRLARLEQQAA